MAPSTSPPSGVNHSVEHAGVALGAEAVSIASHHVSPPEEQKQAAKFQRALAVIQSMPRARPYVVGGALGPLVLYLLSKLPDQSLWGPIEVPGVSLGVLIGLGSFGGSLIVGWTVKLAGIVASTPQHYWDLFEVWSKFRLGRIPPEQYYAYGAALDYQRIYRGIPPNARPETQDQFVRRVIQWRMKSSQGTKGSPSVSGPRTR